MLWSRWVTGIVNFHSVIAVKQQFISWTWNILGHMDLWEHLEEIGQDFWLVTFVLKFNQQRSLQSLAFSLQKGCRAVSGCTPRSEGWRLFLPVVLIMRDGWELEGNWSSAGTAITVARGSRTLGRYSQVPILDLQLWRGELGVLVCPLQVWEGSGMIIVRVLWPTQTEVMNLQQSKMITRSPDP